MSTSVGVILVAITCFCCLRIVWASSSEIVQSDVEADVAEWNANYSSQRAKYYLKFGKQLVNKAIKKFEKEANTYKGNGPPPTGAPYSTEAFWQITAAFRLDENTPGVWFTGANLTYTLAGLKRVERDQSWQSCLEDSLDFWHHALWLEFNSRQKVPGGSASKGKTNDNPSEGPRARELFLWLQSLSQVNQAQYSKNNRPPFPLGLWLVSVRKALATVQDWQRQMRQGSLREKRPQQQLLGSLPGLPAHKKSRLLVQGVEGSKQCSPSSSACAPRQLNAKLREEGAEAADSLWGSKLAAAHEIIFPTSIYHFNVLDVMGSAVFQDIANTAISRYLNAQDAALKEYSHVDMKWTNVNSYFFSQNTVLVNLVTGEEANGELWKPPFDTEDFQQLLTLARNSSLAYLWHSGTQVSETELRKTNLHLWLAVYPQSHADMKQVRHDWHTHAKSVLSGVIYPIPSDNMPLLLADPRGGGPQEYSENVLEHEFVFEPRAPFVANRQIFAKQGDVVLFPSWLAHKVPAPLRESAGFRVACPFNLVLANAQVWDAWERTASPL